MGLVRGPAFGARVKWLLLDFRFLRLQIGNAFLGTHGCNDVLAEKEDVVGDAREDENLEPNLRRRIVDREPGPQRFTML